MGGRLSTAQKTLSIQPCETPCLIKRNPEMIVLKYLLTDRTLRYIINKIFRRINLFTNR